jgi:hypothetical protein
MGKFLNKHLSLLLILTLSAVSLTYAQSFDNIASAIRTGNSSSLATNFSANVEITIKDAEASYSKAQAEMVLKNFFSTRQPKSFSIVHQGTSPEGSKYFIGNLVTSGGNYRTYVYAKMQGSALVVQEIRFEEQ